MMDLREMIARAICGNWVKGDDRPWQVWLEEADSVIEALSQRASALGGGGDCRDGWKEATIAWEVCASIHRTWANGKDALYSTRQADFVRHAEDARKKYHELGVGESQLERQDNLPPPQKETGFDTLPDDFETGDY